MSRIRETSPLFIIRNDGRMNYRFPAVVAITTPGVANLPMAFPKKRPFKKNRNLINQDIRSGFPEVRGVTRFIPSWMAG